MLAAGGSRVALRQQPGDRGSGAAALRHRCARAGGRRRLRRLGRRVIPPVAPSGPLRTARTAARAHRKRGALAPETMRDLTFSDVERLEAAELDVPFEMDEDAFRAFYDRTARSLWGYLSRMTGDPHARRRSAAGKLLPLPAHARPLGERVSPPRLSLSDCHQPRAGRAPARAPRAHRRRCLNPTRTRSSTAGGDHAEASVRRTDLRRAMDRLRPRERALLWLAYAQGHAHTEIADTLGVKTGSVKLLLFRARRKLAGMLRAVPGAHRWRPVVKTVDCCREDDVLDALTSGRWPDRADDELRAHVAACAICADVVEVASAVLRGPGRRARRDANSLVGGDVVAGADARASGSRTRGRAADQRGAGRRAGDARRRDRRRARRAVAVVRGDCSGGWMLRTSSADAARATWRLLRAPSGMLRARLDGAPAAVIGLGVWLVLAPVAIYFAVADD